MLVLCCLTPAITFRLVPPSPQTLLSVRGSCLGIDIILIGDSLGMTALGYPQTTGVTMDEMVHHCAAVQRGNTASLLVGDLPFGRLEYPVMVYHLSIFSLTLW